MAKKKIKLPKEVKVGIYVVGSAALAALVDYLSSLETNYLMMALINVLIVLIKERYPQIKAKLKK